jgi:hypothetical protein
MKVVKEGQTNSLKSMLIWYRKRWCKLWESEESDIKAV